MKILALDLGKTKSVGCIWSTEEQTAEYVTVKSNAQAIHDLVVSVEPARVVFEVGPISNWVYEVVRALEIEAEVINPNHEAWRWKHVKRKTDRDDALKIARLSGLGELGTVYMPEREVRQWRGLIAFRRSLRDRRTATKNQIRSLLLSEGIEVPSGHGLWSQRSLDLLMELQASLDKVEKDSLWRAQLAVLVEQLCQTETHIALVDRKLDALGKADRRVTRLKSIPGVGPRLAEAVVALIDRHERFRNGSQVSAYIGMVPRQYQSGNRDVRGRITKRGNALVRALLVEIAWSGLRNNAWMRSVYDRVCRGAKTRRNIAIVAVARRLLVRCWAMLRDERDWQPMTSM